MECDWEFRSHVCAAHRPSEEPEPENDAELLSYDEGAADE
jgi:hypothetical protein